MPIKRRALRALEAVLPQSVALHVTKDQLFIQDKPLRVKWIGEGWLADVKPLLDQDAEKLDIVVATHMSPGAQEALSDAAIGWVDETGAAEIALGSLIVAKSGRPVEKNQRITDWTPAVLAVAEALLCGIKGTVACTKEATGLSTGSCTNALRFLSNKDLLVADAARGRHSDRRIADFDKLLYAYAGAVADMKAPPVVKVGVTWRDLASGLAKVGPEWEIGGWQWSCTGTLAASILAPFQTSVGLADVYISEETVSGLEAAARYLKLEPMEGGRLRLRPFPTVTVPRLSSEVDGLRLAPWPRVYADLRPTGVRGEEAAEHLKEVMGAQ